MAFSLVTQEPRQQVTEGARLAAIAPFTGPHWVVVPVLVRELGPQACWRAVVCSAGGDGGRRSPEHLAARAFERIID